jgi:pimeloyl-ACP methyl ester carboxylesterase
MLMAYDEAGSGAAVVLLHSSIADRRMWEPQWQPLAARYRVVRPDLRGFGGTPLPPERFSFGSDVVALLDEVGLQRAVLVGSSLGGRVALEVAAGWPDRVRGLVLLCPAFRGLPLTARAEEFGAQEEHLLAQGDVDGAVKLNVETWLGPVAGSQTRALVREMQRRAFEVQLAAEKGDVAPEPEVPEVDPAAVAPPALVVSGDRDMDHFQRVAAHLARTMPAARLVELPWAAHLPSLERPQEINELLLDYLDGLPK